MTFFKGPYRELPSQKHGPWPFLDGFEMYKGRLVLKSFVEKLKAINAKRQKDQDGDEEEDEESTTVDAEYED